MLTKLFKISRPRFWIYLLGPYLLGVIAGGSILGFTNPEIWYGLFYFLIPANLFIYTVNDYFDQEIDATNPKKMKEEVAMQIKDKKMYLIAIIVSLVLAIPLLFTGTLSMLALLLFLFVGFFYSTPPVRFKTRPILDSISNFFYILPGVYSYTLLTGSLPPIPILISGSLWAIAMHLFSAIVDISADRKTGIQTTATTLGYTNSLLLTSILWFFSVVLILPYSWIVSIGFIYAAIPIAILVKRYNITRAYWLFPIVNLIMGFSIFCLLLLNA